MPNIIWEKFVDRRGCFFLDPLRAFLANPQDYVFVTNLGNVWYEIQNINDQLNRKALYRTRKSFTMTLTWEGLRCADAGAVHDLIVSLNATFSVFYPAAFKTKCDVLSGSLQDLSLQDLQNFWSGRFQNVIQGMLENLEYREIPGILTVQAIQETFLRKLELLASQDLQMGLRLNVILDFKCSSPSKEKSIAEEEDLQKRTMESMYDQERTRIENEKRATDIRDKTTILQLEQDLELLKKKHEDELQKIDDEQRKRQVELELLERRAHEAKSNEVLENAKKFVNKHAPAALIDETSRRAEAYVALCDAGVDEADNDYFPKEAGKLWTDISDDSSRTLLRNFRHFLSGYGENPLDIRVQEVQPRSLTSSRNETTEMECNVLRKNQSLQFSFTAPIDGKLTVLNIGTSGRVTELFPNVQRESFALASGKTYQFPENFIPNVSFTEEDDSGLEGIYVFITPENLLRSPETGDLCTHEGAKLAPFILDFTSKIRDYEQRACAVGRQEFIVQP